MKRVNTRGIKQANKHILMAALVYNLKKYLRFITKKPIIKMADMNINKPIGLQNPEIGFYNFIKCILTTFRISVANSEIREFGNEANTNSWSVLSQIVLHAI